MGNEKSQWFDAMLNIYYSFFRLNFSPNYQTIPRRVEFLYIGRYPRWWCKESVEIVVHIVVSGQPGKIFWWSARFDAGNKTTSCRSYSNTLQKLQRYQVVDYCLIWPSS
jgi:hypothetical protein